MSAPIRKVAPNGFGSLPQAPQLGKVLSAITAAEAKPIQDSLGAFGTVVSSTAPQSLHRCTTARGSIRRLIAVK